MRAPVLDLGFSSWDIEQHLITVGYWNTESRRERHACVLTPCAYVFNEELIVAKAAMVLYKAVTRLEITLQELSHRLRLDHSESQFLRIGKRAAHGLLQPGEETSPTVPPMIKIDMVRDRDRWYAVEIDAYNPRALGTVALVDGLAKRTGKSLVSDIVTHLAPILGHEHEWVFLISEKERYYGTAYEMLCSLLKKEGVRTRCVQEAQVAENASLLTNRDGLLHLFAIPENLDRHPAIRNHLLKGYRAGIVRLFYPPKAYLGSKAFLPFIAAQEGVNGTIPPTALLTGYPENCIFSRPRERERIILKHAHSSGSKNIVRQNDLEIFYKTIDEGRQSKNPLWIAQEEVRQEPVAVTVFDRARRVIRPYYLRLTVYATACGIAGIKVTGRQNEIVHGASDCIQMPVVKTSV